MENGSVEDRWWKMGLCGSPALAAGSGGGGPLRGWPGPVSTPGVLWDCSRAWVVVGPCTGFPGGPAVFPVSLWSLDGACSPVLRPLPCVLAGPSHCCRPFLLVPCVQLPRAPFPCLGPSWPHLIWVLSPSLCWLVVSPRWGGVWGMWGPPVCGGRVFSLAGLWLLGVCWWWWV